jgi:hypothetical protein
MSFGNQFEARLLDRRAIQQTLLELRDSRTLPWTIGRDWSSHLAWIRSLTDSRSDVERAFVDALAGRFLRLPRDAQRGIDAPRCVPDFFYEPNVCVFCDGRVHDAPDVRAQDDRIRTGLRDAGYRVIVIRYDRDMAEQIAANADIFGSPST